MKAKIVYLVLGVVGVGTVVGGIVLSLPKRPVEPQAAAPEAERLASVERRAAHVERLQRKLRAAGEDGASPTANERKALPVDSSQLVMVDVADLDDSEWVQSMYDSAYRYEGPTSKEALEKNRQAKVGVHTETTMREREDALAQAMPEMRAEIEKARKEREAEQKRFEQVGESAEAKAARDGVQLED